eukprot:jgi/Mesvir1/4051/Mv09578-RA.2
MLGLKTMTMKTVGRFYQTCKERPALLVMGALVEASSLMGSHAVLAGLVMYAAASSMMACMRETAQWLSPLVPIEGLHSMVDCLQSWFEQDATPALPVVANLDPTGEASTPVRPRNSGPATASPTHPAVSTAAGSRCPGRAGALVPAAATSAGIVAVIAFPAAPPQHEPCIRAALTERPCSDASAAPMWWGDDSERPHTWTMMVPSFPFKCEPLGLNSDEYRFWTGRMDMFGLKVTAVTRVQNPALWKRYHEERLRMLDNKMGRRREDIRADLPPYDLHESLLYHCSGYHVHAKIYEEGLDLPLPTRLGTFGHGIYLTDDPRKAATYSNPTGKLYVCAALLGDVLAVPARDKSAPWRTEPEKAAEDRRSPTDKHFDSLVGRQAVSSGGTGPNEFVLYNQSAICPMYVVEYTGAGMTWSNTSHAVCGVPDFAWKSKGARGKDDVQDPFGIAAGTSNFVAYLSRWDLFLHSFYQALFPDSNLELCKIPLGQPVPAGRARHTSLNAATPVCIGRPITELLLAKHPGLKCMMCQIPLRATGKDLTCLVMPCGHINGHVKCWGQAQAPTQCMACQPRLRVTSGQQLLAIQAPPPAQTTTASTWLPPSMTPAVPVGHGGHTIALLMPAPVGVGAQPAGPAPAASFPANAAVLEPQDQRCISATPTERPSSGASAPPMWWGDDTDRPHTWTQMRPSVPFECVPLDEDSTEHRFWSNHMEKFGLEVTAVTRIQNPRLWERYVLERRHMLQGKVGMEDQGGQSNLPLFDFHESLLYHCSSEPDYTKICGQGLDLRLNEGGFFGHGIYLTDDPRKAATYSNNTCKLYVCAALLGDVLAVPARDNFAPWKTEPEKAVEDQRTPTDTHFDSLVGRRADVSSGTTGANEFVLYKQSATCPMYMVEFAGISRKRSRDTPRALRGVPDFAWKSKAARGKVNVQDPFGITILTGTRNYHAGSSRWDLFLHSFYQMAAPEYDKPIWTSPIGKNVMNGVTNSTSPRTVCTGRLVTEKVLAKHPGCKCTAAVCHSPLIKGDICMVMPCGHINGHDECCHPLIQTRVMADGVTSQTFTRCEVCMQRFGVTVGKQPLSAKMTHRVDPGITLAGHAPGVIKITYSVPGGTQDPDGDDPGKLFEGTYRTAYLPDSSEGRDVLKWLQQAFQQRLIFSVGTSLTTRKDNVVIWAGIQHKTDLTPHSEHGYPNGTYLTHVKEAMQKAGVILL